MVWVAVRRVLRRLHLSVSWRARAAVAGAILVSFDPAGENAELRRWASEYVGVDLAHWPPNMPRGDEQP